MHKKLKYLGLLLAGMVAAVLWFYQGFWPGAGHLSANDVLAIKRAVRQEAPEPILKIYGEDNGTAKVVTGRYGNGLDGSGREYFLNRTPTGWQIVRREGWMSGWPNKPDAAYGWCASPPGAGRPGGRALSFS